MKKITLLLLLLFFIKTHAQGNSVLNAEQFCSGGGELVFSNVTGAPNATSVGCLGSIPNGSYYNIEIDRPGDLVFTITQTALNGTPIDVDFVAWGPFADLAVADASINLVPCTPTDCPSNSVDPTFYPYATDFITDCSFSGAPVENLSINGAVAGDIYVVLITNFADLAGNISIEQTVGTGSTSCSGIPVCGTGFYDNGGEIDNYLNGEVNNTTTIFPDVASGVVTVTFNSFDLADAGDTLAVYDGDTATTLIGTYTGTTIPASFTSTDPSGALTFVFNSNASGAGVGWDADVTCTEPPPTPICGTTFTDSGGTGGNYSNNEFNITTFYPDNAGEVVTVAFTVFDIESSLFDYMNVYDGPNTLISSIIGQISGSQNDLSFTSTHPSGALTFRFVSDGSNTFPGWSANITCGVPTLDCGVSFYDSGGSGGRYSNDQFLVNTFYPDNPGELVTATFNDFRTENGNDELYIFDGPNRFTTLLGIYSGNTNPPSFTSSDPSGALTFVFISDESTRSRGWDVDITCFNPLSSCGSIFYDDGGPSGNYSNNQNDVTTTFFPDSPGDAVTATFTSFRIRNNGDTLDVYDGPDATYPLLATLLGNLNGALPEFTSSDPSGALTFVFNSNGSGRREGWVANITCSTPPCDLTIIDIPNGASCNPLYNELTVSDNIVFSENFDDLGTPFGWSIINAFRNTQWSVGNTSNAGGDPNEFILAYLRNNRNRDDTWSLTSPSLSINGYTSLQLSYYQFLEDSDFENYPYSIFVETSVDAGAWVTQIAITPNGDVGPNIPNIDLSALTGNTLQIRFRMTGMPYGFVAWAIDNILITGDGSTSAAPITWSPITNLYTDSSLTTSYTGGFTDTVYANPSSTQTYTATNTSSGCEDTIIVARDSNTWNGSSSGDANDWNQPGNWSHNAVPTATDCVIIPNISNNPTIYAGNDGNALNLTIEAGAILTQQPNSTLTIVNAINVESSGTYNLQDSASLIQIDDVANTVNGTFTMDRIANIRSNDYVYWSSPVTNFNIENVSPDTPNGFKYQWLPFVNRVPISPAVPLNYGEWERYNTGVMEVGKGYIIKGPTGQPSAPSPFTASFSGNPNNGLITQSILRGNYTDENGYLYRPYAGGAELLVTQDDDNWNLIGNPYPSAINATAFLELPANSNIYGTVYLWTHGTDISAGADDPFYQDYAYNYSDLDYLLYNASGSLIQNGFNGNIGAGQGFFVIMTDLVSPADPNTPNNPMETVTFNNDMRNNTFANNEFFRNSDTSDSDTNKSRIWLDYISANGTTNTTLIAYIDGATNGTDRMFDAIKLQGTGLNLYSLIDTKAYLIQGRQLPFEDTDIVPLGIEITESGIQTIAINALEGLFDDANNQIFLEDLQSGLIHNLKNAPYTFTSEEGIIDDRFVLRYRNETLGIDDFDAASGIKVFEENEQIIIKSPYEPIGSVEVFDILGRSLFSNKLVNLNGITIATLKPEQRVLFFKIILTDGKQKITKIIF